MNSEEVERLAIRYVKETHPRYFMARPEFEDDVDHIIDAFASGYKVARVWFKIEQKLPEENLEVLVWSKLDGCQIAFLHNSFFYTQDLSMKIFPTHWMYLPADAK